MKFTHFDEKGNARMVDVTHKERTERIAVASGKRKVSGEVCEAVRKGSAAKGDVLTVATTSGIAGAKRTWELIPMCHILPLTGCAVKWELDENNFEIKCRCTVRCTDKTGVEMEALTGVSVALLTVYDMCKSMDRTMEIEDIHLIEKDGGKSGHFIREE